MAISYHALNHPVLERVPARAERICDLGCGTGALGAAIKQERACEIVGVTFSEDEAREARTSLDEVVVADLNSWEPTALGKFDCVVCSHVLEHLYDPGRLLRAFASSFTEGGVLVVALPNVLHWKQRMRFMRGDFRYTQGGLMDSTHFRFFDWSTAAELVTSSGYKIEEAKACGGFPLSRYLRPVSKTLDRAALAVSPGMFGSQFVFVCSVARSS